MKDLTTMITFRIDHQGFVVHYDDIQANNVEKVLRSMLIAYLNNDCSMHIESAVTDRLPLTKEALANLDTIEDA